MPKSVAALYQTQNTCNLILILINESGQIRSNKNTKKAKASQYCPIAKSFTESTSVLVSEIFQTSLKSRVYKKDFDNEPSSTFLQQSSRPQKYYSLLTLAEPS